MEWPPRRLDDAVAPDLEDVAVGGGGHDVAGDAHLAQSTSGAGVDVVEAGRRRTDAAMMKRKGDEGTFRFFAPLRANTSARGGGRDATQKKNCGFFTS